MIMDNKPQANLKETLEGLWMLDHLDMGGDGVPDYESGVDNLMNLFSGSIKQVNELLDKLNFDDPKEAHLLKFVPDIVGNLNTLEEQVIFVEHLKLLQKKFPNVNFSKFIFYAKMSYKV